MELKAEELIKHAEHLKAYIIRPPGKAHLSHHTYSGCDDSFFQSLSHVDKTTREKIKRGESVDLAKLLPRNKYKQDEHKMELLSKDGKSFCVPVKMSDKESGLTINSHSTWEKAFRVYTAIYSPAHPHRSWELI